MPLNRHGKLPEAELDRRDVQTDRLHQEGRIRNHLSSFLVQRSQSTIDSLGKPEVNQQKDYF